jgi:DNA-binding NarL/FixJ family response regulator
MGRSRDLDAVLAAIVSNRPRALFLIQSPLSVHYRERMRQAGAAAYVLKNEAIEELVDAVSAALRGEPFPSRAVVPADAAIARRSVEIDKYRLSARERDVLRLLAEGKRTREVAELLEISPKTVETYRARLINKLGIENLSGLVRFAIRAGLVSPES